MAKLGEIDRRWIFLTIAAALVLTLLFPFRQPITPSPSVKAVYDFIEDLPEGSTVIIATDFDPQAKAETVPITLALLHHCFRRNIRIIGMTFWPEGAPLGTRLFTEVGDELGKISGRDYVYLGFKPGAMSQVITNMGESFTSAFPQDARNQPTSSMPIFRDIGSLPDLQLIIDVAAGATVEGWIIYGGDKYSVPMAAGCTAVSAPDLYVYTNSGQLKGIIAGMRGAADYEALLEKPGQGIAGMPAQSAAHAIIVLFVIFANIIYFHGRRADRRRAEGTP